MAARKTDPKSAVELETLVEKIADICRACWPDGWPHLSHSASCEHGAYVRDPEPPAPVQDPQDPATPPADPTGT
jgi:hypothetical protein